MYSLDEYNSLKSKYGSYASWAIWDYENPKNTSVIRQNIDQLHSKYILLGLNIARPISGIWLNFHGGSIHDRKLMYACHDTILRGSYMTDIFKGIEESKSNKLKDVLTEKVIRENVDFFIQEMKDIQIQNDSQFIVFGVKNSCIANYFNTYFRQNFRNKIYYYYHYAYYGLTDREWVTGFWKQQNIHKEYTYSL